MPSGTLSIRTSPSTARRSRLPVMGGAAACAPIPSPRMCERNTGSATPHVLSAALADTIRDSLPSAAFVDAFDRLLDSQSPNDPNPAVRPADRTVLRFLMTYRWCRVRPTLEEAARQTGRRVRHVKESVDRLKQCALLPCGDHL